MIDWKYKPPKKKITLIPEGTYRLRFKNWELKKKEYDYVKITFDVSGYDTNAYTYVTFANEEIVRKKTTAMARSFGIPFQTIEYLNWDNWIGKYGAGVVKHESFKTKDGKTSKSNRVETFLDANQQAWLPAWIEGDQNSNEDDLEVIDW